MFRVVTKYHNGSPRPIVERGPWHTSRKTADDWAKALRDHGYVAYVETQGAMLESDTGAAGNDNADLMAALASMA